MKTDTKKAQDWRADDSGMYIIAGPDSMSNPPRTIACSPSPNGWRKEDRDLIAAAPDLLEAVRAQAELIRRMVAEGFIDGPDLTESGRAQALAICAISKAEGR